MKKVEEITSKYTSDTVDPNKKRPNVIAVINEAFSDMPCLGYSFSPSEDGLLNFLCILHSSVQLPTMALHASDITEMQPFLLEEMP